MPCDVPARKAGGTGAGSTSADGAARHPYQFRRLARLHFSLIGAGLEPGGGDPEIAEVFQPLRQRMEWR
jgi:hypothetical protein